MMSLQLLGLPIPGEDPTLPQPAHITLVPGPSPQVGPLLHRACPPQTFLPVPSQASHPATVPLGPCAHPHQPSNPTSPQDLPPPPPSPNQLAFVAASCCALGMAGQTGISQPYKTGVQLSHHHKTIRQPRSDPGWGLTGSGGVSVARLLARSCTTCSFRVSPSWECYNIVIPAFLCKTSPLSQSPGNKGIMAHLRPSCL